MGLREKVAIVSLAVIFIQIACTHCMPRNITSQLKSNRLKRILAYRPSTENTMTKNYQTTNSITNKNDKTKKAKNKYSLNLLTKLIKEAKTPNDPTKATLDPLSPYSKPFATTPQPFCYKELGTFPEVEYPMYVMDTWAPKYWKTLPTVQKTKGEPSNDCSEIKTSPEPKYIKPSDKAIEKAISALIKLRSKGVNKALKGNEESPLQLTSSTPRDICPLDPPNQCLPTDKSGVTNTSTPTCIPPTDSASVKDLCDTTTATPFIENDTNQLPTPTSVTSEYEYEVIPTATTAMPSSGTSPISSTMPADELALLSPVSTDSVSATLPISTPKPSTMSNDTVISSNCNSLDPCDDAFSPTDSLLNSEDVAQTSIIDKVPVSGATSAVNPILPSDETALPLTQAVPITPPSNPLSVSNTALPTNVFESTPASEQTTPTSSILPSDENAIPLMQAAPIIAPYNSLPVSDTASSTIFDNTLVSGATSSVSQKMTSDETALPLTQAIPITSSSNSLPVPDTTLPTSVVDSTPVSPILPCDETALPLAQAVPTEDTCDSNLLPTSDTSPDNNFGLSDYDFATMPPPDISYDTTIKNVNPDDMSTKFSPGDTDYIWT